MTGIFVRVPREGGWVNLEIEDLTEHELGEWVNSKEKPFQLNLIYVLVSKIKELSDG